MNERGPIIYIVDDDVSVCRALSLLLRSYGFEVVTFSTAAGFLAFKHPQRPSCLVLDIKLPNMNGLALQDAMAVRRLDIPIVFITGHGNIPMSVQGMKAGAVDFLPKPFRKKKLLDAVALAVLKSKAMNRDRSEASAIKRRIATLSPRELEVFNLVAKGMLSKQIALKQGRALQTIKVHRSRVMQKMQAKTAVELILLAQRAGVIPPLRVK